MPGTTTTHWQTSERLWGHHLLSH